MSKNWIADATASMERRGTKGKFSESAKRAGMSTGAYARKVLADPNASETKRKQAQFAKNVEPK